jgi:hypothetical protein
VIGWLWLGIRLGVKAGILSGLIAGLIAGLGGSLLTGSLPDLAAFAVSAFWLVLVILPLVYTLQARVGQSDGLYDHRTLVTAVAWPSAFVMSLVCFMMPVVMSPLLLGRGVTLENSADWYNQVYSPLLGGPAFLVGIATLIAFAVIARLIRPTNK